MNNEEFLAAVLPDTGFYCLARPHEQGYFLHRVVESVDEVLAVAGQMDNQLLDVYFAIASLKERRVWDPSKNDGKGGYRYRTKSNIHSLKAVFFEADVLRPDELDGATDADLERKYTSQQEALTGIRQFCKDINWPLPLLVNSGWGFHFYWPLLEAVTPTEYEVLTKKLKLAAKHFKFKLDVSAADVSRVFRVPGTHNNKDPHNRKRVTILKSAPPVAFSTLSDALDAVLSKQQISTDKIAERFNIPDYLNFGDSNTEDFTEPMKLRPIVQKCAALRECFTNPDDISYHHWYHALQVVRHCEDGHALAHKLSELSSDYDAGETDKMLRSLEEKGIPPTLCDTFANDTDACASCPYRNKIRTPAVFGRDTKSFKQNAQRAMVSAAGKMPPPPWPYKHSPGKGVLMERVDKDGNQYDEVIFQYDLEPVKRLFSEREQRELTLWKTNNPADGFVEIEMPSAALYDKKTFSTALADSGVYCDLHTVDLLRGYMISYVQEIQRVFMKEFLYSRLGWREDNQQFVLGEHLYTPTKIMPCNTERRGRVMASIEQRGSLDNWKRILKFFDSPSFAGHQLAIGVGFGSILMQFTGISGGIVNMVGRSGEGKSTVQKVINSIWGHPTKLMLPAESKSSTYNAKISFINMMNNLPICAEEITNASQDEIGSLAYAISQGSEKWRADIKGTVRESAGGWCTIMVSSANNSLHEKLAGAGGAVAKALRVFEYHMTHVRKFSKAEFQQGVDLALIENYGLAGPRLVEHVLVHQEDVKQRLYDRMVSIDRSMALQPEERVWSAVLACSLMGLELAQELDLIDYDIDAVEEFARQQVKVLRGTVESLMPPAQEVLAQYLSENIRSMIVVEQAVVAQQKTQYVLHKPTDKLHIRFESVDGRIYISTNHLRSWCNELGYMYNELIDNLRAEGIVLNMGNKKVLSSGADFTTGQVRVITIDARAVAFSGSLKRVKSTLQTAISNTGGN